MTSPLPRSPPPTPRPLRFNLISLFHPANPISQQLCRLIVRQHAPAFASEEEAKRDLPRAWRYLQSLTDEEINSDQRRAVGQVSTITE